MNDNLDDIISAALDGEYVDVQALQQVLATDDGRKTLASFVLIRAATAADSLEPAGMPLAVTASVPAARRALPTVRMWRKPRVFGSLAAALVILAVAASFWMGTRWPTTSASLPEPSGSSGVTIRGQAMPPGIPDRAAVVPAPGAPSSEARTIFVRERPGGPSRERPPVPVRFLRFMERDKTMAGPATAAPATSPPDSLGRFR